MIRKNNAAESTKLTAALNIILLIVLIMVKIRISKKQKNKFIIKCSLILSA